VILAGTAMMVAGISVWVLYLAALQEERARLTEAAQSQARLIEAVARFEVMRGQAEDADGLIATALAPVIDAHGRYRGFGETGEFTLARRSEGRIEFLLSHRHFDLDNPRPVAWESNLAEPMRRALSGQSGTIVGLDYRGVEVLAAYEPVDVLGLGIVAKIDLSEIHAPFIKAGILAGAGAFVVILLGSLLFRAVTAPIVERERTEKALQRQDMSMHLLHTVAAAANEAPSVEAAMQACLEAVCGYCGWPVGHAYAVDEQGSGELVPTRLWRLDDPEHFAVFRQVTEATRFAPGVGLPGRVLVRGEPVWIIDVTKDSNFPRAKMATDLGVKGAFAFPVLVGREVAAVLEFFAQEAIEPDGHILDIMAQVGTLLGRVIERKRAETALRESEERLRQATQLAGLGHWVWDAIEERCLYCSEEHARIHGVSVEEYLARASTPGGDLSFTHPDDLEKYEAAVKGLRRGEAFDLEYRLVALNGETRFVREVARPVLDATGSVVREFGTVQDITEMKRAEEGLRQAQKMEAVGQLTGGVAHDFNNLLAVIMANAEILQTRLGDEVRPLQAVLRAAARGAELTQRLVAFARNQPLEPQSINLDALVANMSYMLHLSLGETVDIEIRLAAELWPAMADPGQLENAILNLAINARDAMPGGGQLIIESANATLGKSHTAKRHGLSPGDYVMLAVSDSGSGMTPEVLERAVEPFFTTKDVGQGSGLGLSMVYGFAKQSGGDLVIDSQEGKGTTMRLYLPRTRAEIRPVEEETATEAPRGRGEAVLVVEDDRDVRALTEAMLEDLGYRVLSAEDGRAGLAALEGAPQIDLLLSDVVLPGGMSGPDLAVQAGLQDSDLKVLFMSGYADNAIRRSGLAGGDIELLRKPFEKQELARKVRAALDH
jgi:PAS domain S-box-containing protein